MREGADEEAAPMRLTSTSVVMVLSDHALLERSARFYHYQQCCSTNKFCQISIESTNGKERVKIIKILSNSHLSGLSCQMGSHPRGPGLEKGPIQQPLQVSGTDPDTGIGSRR